MCIRDSGYTTTSVNASGSIIKDDTAAVTFTNTRNSSSSHHSVSYTHLDVYKRQGWKASTVPDMLNGDDHYAYVVGYSDGTVRPNANISRCLLYTSCGRTHEGGIYPFQRTVYKFDR